MSRLLNYLPQFERDSSTFKEIMKAKEIEFSKLEYNLQDLEEQFVVKTATWALAIYEKEYGLPIEPDIDINIRRALISSKILMQPPSSKVQLVEILKNFIETAEIDEHFNEYRFDVILKTLDAVGDKLKYIKDVVDEFKPAHLSYMFIICYLYYPKLYTKFKRHLSSKLKVCGTIDVSGNEYSSATGKSYISRIGYSCNRWPSLELPKVFIDRKMGSVGVTHKSGFKYNYSNWLSVAFPLVFEGRAIHNIGMLYKDKAEFESKSNLSEQLRVCSEKSYVKEVTI